ncbi:MAG: hypothetical protein TE42_01695 [Candidatus Synechococcus spongiarum SP3]|uniref:OmpA-like domain-containing protein n=1 Tax=Candidatus Synechococcus spongiarum SP3 TaxID=1604020 RepID=A0A0G2J5I5_9SYNE|nr:MAG: hypothetical protein TE42_01695 [Candidatus Synechococcus spongiarum SP3]
MASARRTRGKEGDNGINPWLGYTDVLSSMLLIVLLAMGLVTLAKALNEKPLLREKPPLISLTETDNSFRFPTGNYGLSQTFINALDVRYTTEIKPTIEAFDVDVIEVIGHTDGQPSARRTSNLDRRLPTVALQGEFTGFQVGSNAGLGLLRAMAVSRYLQARLEEDQLAVGIRPYSASSLLDPQGDFNPAPTVSDPTRRRIEIRFTRSY